MTETDKNENRHLRYLGLDYGQVRIGVSLSDALAITAQPHSVIQRKTDLTAIEEIHDIVRENEVTCVVVGLPKNMDGSLGPQAQVVQDFIEMLGSELNEVEMVEWDERLSTMQSERLMIEAGVSRAGRKKKIDKVAATIILQSYLDYVSNQNSSL